MGGRPDSPGTQQDRPQGAARRITHQDREEITGESIPAADSGWGDWSEDVDRTYQAPPPAGLNDRQLRVYRKIAWHWGRARSIPSQKLLSEELDIPVRTLKYDIAVLKREGWLDSDRRKRRGYRGGGQLKAGNTYFPKVSLNDLPGEAFPQVAPRGKPVAAGGTEGQANRVDSSTEGPTGQGPSDQVTPRGKAIPTGHTEGPTGEVPSVQVTPRGKGGSLPLGDGGKAEESARSDRPASPVDNPRNTPTVSEKKPVQERVSPQPEVELSSPGGRPRFRTMAEEKAWAAARARLPPEVDDDIVMVLVKLQEAGMLRTARVLKVERA